MAKLVFPPELKSNFFLTNEQWLACSELFKLAYENPKSAVIAQIFPATSQVEVRWLSPKMAELVEEAIQQGLRREFAEHRTRKGRKSVSERSRR